MGTIFKQIPRCDMIDKRNKCEPVILFKITKKEADFVRKLPRTLQDEFEDYQKLKYKFHYLSKLISELIPLRKEIYTAPYHPAVH